MKQARVVRLAWVSPSEGSSVYMQLMPCRLSPLGQPLLTSCSSPIACEQCLRLPLPSLILLKGGGPDDN